jgi:tetratricopeptide (TPR) repeat protein
MTRREDRRKRLSHLMFGAIAMAALLAAGCVPGHAQPLSQRLQAKADFDKVDAAPIPDIVSTQACVQSNAAALLVTRAEERYLVYYRKGYCELFRALIDGAADSFQDAARDFTEAIAAWPKKAATPPPGGLRALVAISHLENGRLANSYPDLGRDLGAVVDDPGCLTTPLMARVFCTAVIDTARTWLGWLAYNKNDLTEAAKVLEPMTHGTPVSPWALWIQGRLAQQQGRVADAVALYEKALAAWSAAAETGAPDVVSLLGPKLDTGAVHYQLALAYYSRQTSDLAITHFDAGLKAHPKNSYAIFLRGRSKEALHLNGPAMDDYALATQTARAENDSSWNVAQAHYYRGLLLYQAKDYPAAEGEFTLAMSGRLGDIGKPDVSAWKIMSTVAGSGCKSSDALDAAIQAASDKFPKGQANALVFDCRLKQATKVDQYIALAKLYENRLDGTKLRELKALIANAYAAQGVAAEDSKDPYSAVAAYRKAIEWDPGNSKARFNLGAIYIEDKHYEQAETEYRALVKADASDYEAHYWLALSILAQHPEPWRVTEACGLLQKAIAINDPGKKAQFLKAMGSAGCPK